MKKELKDELTKKATEGKISCAVAQSIAVKLGLPYHEVGAAANELKIKIKECQLGCF